MGISISQGKLASIYLMSLWTRDGCHVVKPLLHLLAFVWEYGGKGNGGFLG